MPCYREKLEDDEEFELIGDVSEAVQNDKTRDAAANGNDLRTNDGLATDGYVDLLIMTKNLEN